MNTQGIRYLALGDSYTIGEGVAEEDRYPNQLLKRLEQSGIPTAKAQIIATTGWTTSDLKAAIADENPQGPFDRVSLLIGVNNQYQGKEESLYVAEFEELVQNAIRLAGHKKERVFVISIPDYGVTPFAVQRNPAQISQEIDRYNAINRQISLQYGLHYFDITPISRQADHDLSLLAEDQLHPSGKMYALWVDMMQDSMMRMGEIRQSFK
jgi:lysophospholipase L1-like esterase